MFIKKALCAVKIFNFYREIKISRKSETFAQSASLKTTNF